jgi:V8-like Glu-specific endopeptidase
MKCFLVLGALALVTTSGCGAPAPAPEATATSASTIQGGTSDTTHDFAVGIGIDLGGNEGAVCSGALLAPNLVATARHCADQLSSDQIDCASSTFGTAYAPGQYVITNGSVLGQGPIYAVSKIVTPTGADQTGVCGNDIALLILSTNIQLSQYVQPVLSPPMTDHSMWATTVTAIGYGIDSPTDSSGKSAGTRRILENIGLVCIPDDPSFVDCYSDPTAKQYIDPSEFESGDGTCEGDSGSSAFDQVQFNKGKWVSFGVLSRGGVSSDGTTCVGSIYSRFDAWSQLIIDTAKEAAQMGGYAAPAWTTTAASDAGSTAVNAEGGSGAEGGSSAEAGSSAGADGVVCGANDDCLSENCVSTDGTHFVCASACGTGNSCAAGFRCEGGYCFHAAAASTATPSIVKKSGCAVAAAGLDPTHPTPWRAMASGLAVMGLAFRRRRRR